MRAALDQFFFFFFKKDHGFGVPITYSEDSEGWVGWKDDGLKSWGKMFKTMRWRSEKNRIKAVFKLHFQATQVC